MEEQKSYKSWTISDEFWDAIKDYIPFYKRDPQKEYERAPGGGRKPPYMRKIVEGIFYVLRTGIQWKAVPREYGSSSNLHRYFQAFARAGFFETIWAKGLEKFDELKGIGWEWQSLDGCMTKSSLGGEAVGNNPTDRGKKGTKRSVLVDSHGIPLAVVISGANTHDVKLLGETLDATIVERPEVTDEHPQNLCLDAGYTGHKEDVTSRGYIPHIRPRGEEKKEKENDPGFKARRWVVEVSHSWVNRFRKLLVRFEKKVCNHLGLVQFAFAVIVWRKLLNVHKGVDNG